MKPIKLEIKGLNSYIENTTIDFEKLTERKLFGIFGKTGSGKSTILDAITIAMYGITSKKDKEYINSNCDKAQILFEFEIGSKNSKRKYQINRTITRDINSEKNSKAVLLELHNNYDKTIIADSVTDVNTIIIQITGLSETEFVSTVVIPQGKFNDFLKSEGNERKDILEKIFNLEKYGENLINKVKIKKESELQNQRYIKAELDKYEEVNESTYNYKEKELEDLKKQKSKLNNDLELLIKTHQEHKLIYEQQNKLKKYEVRKKELDLKIDSMQIKKNQLEHAINSGKINPHIFTLQNLEKKIEEDNFKFEFLQKKLENLNQQLLLSKNKYEEAYKFKNEKLSKLSEDKIKLERAKELEKDLINLEKELRYLKENNEQLTNKKHNLEKVKVEYQAKKKVCIKSIKEIEKNIIKLKMSQELKEKIFTAYEYEKEYNKIIEEKEHKINKFEQLNKELEELNLKSKYIERDKNNIIVKLNTTIESYEKLMNKSPGKNEDIVNKTEYVVNLKAKLYSFKENEEIKNKIQKELNEVIEIKYNNERETKVLHEKLEYISENILVLEKETDKLRYLNLVSELKKELKENMPCPVCGSRHHTSYSDVNDDIKIIITKEKLDKLKLEESSTKLKLESLNSELIANTILEKIKFKEIEELKVKLGENSYSEIHNRLQEDKRILDLLKDSIHKWNKDKEEITINVNKFNEEKYRIEKEEIKIIEKIKSLKIYTTEIKEEIDLLEEKFKLIGEPYLVLKATLKVSNLFDKIDEINKNEKIIEELNNQYLKVIRNRDEVDEAIREYQSQLHQIELELIKNNEKYEEKHKSKEDKYKEVISITKGEDSSVLLNNIEKKIKDLITKEEIIKNKLEEQRIEYEKYSTEKSNIEGQLKTSKDEQKIQESTLNQLLRDYKFENLYAVKRALLDPDHTRLLQSEIMEYEEEQKILDIKIKEMRDVLSGRRVKEEEFKNTKDNIYNTKVEVENISNKIEIKQQNLIILKESIKKVEELEKKLIIVQNKVNLLKDLYEAIEQKQFVEYIAISKLQNIASGVNDKLGKMTKGRYKLEIDSYAGFIICDNFNNGQSRSIDTLSGGEEFLVSLCLALEVSSQIKLKGDSPLECFFIDEGFGSLDEEHIQIVVDGLERLQNDKLSIGIISHANEIKDRVPIKLIIEENTPEEGSKVKIEYN
ncbi:AAA family ATPase [Romboutsia sp.]|uniref:AAA family ATPase n=1 Tax=Romboutsia sp. TaxID=1965302 RepID=UPI003F3E74A7